MRCIFHKWKYVYKQYPHKFLNEDVIQRYLHFRICEKCGKSQILYSFGDWQDLDPEKDRILKCKLIDKGDYYLLDETRPCSFDTKYITEDVIRIIDLRKWIFNKYRSEYAYVHNGVSLVDKHFSVKKAILNKWLLIRIGKFYDHDSLPSSIVDVYIDENLIIRDFDVNDTIKDEFPFKQIRGFKLKTCDKFKQFMKEYYLRFNTLVYILGNDITKLEYAIPSFSQEYDTIINLKLENNLSLKDLDKRIKFYLDSYSVERTLTKEINNDS